MSESTLQVGSYVQNEKAPDWGIGKILEMGNEGKRRVLFEYSGLKIMQPLNLSPVDAPSNHPLLRSISAATDLTGIKSFAAMEEDFAKQFRQGGFEDPQYLKEERSYKVDAAEIMREQCSRENLEALLKAGDFAEICERATRPVVKTNLVFLIEKFTLADGLKRGPQQKELFANSFFSLLHGPGHISGRFDAFALALEELGACKWPIATYPLFLMEPEQYPLVKPRYIKAAAKAYAFDIRYDVRPSWQSYSSIVNFVHYVAGVLQNRGKLKPRDLIDVQGFIWCSLQSALAPKKKAATSA